MKETWRLCRRDVENMKKWGGNMKKYERKMKKICRKYEGNMKNK